MFFKMLKNDLKAHKGLNIILFIFIVCSSVISVIAANLMYTLVIEKKNTDRVSNVPNIAANCIVGMGNFEEKKGDLQNWIDTSDMLNDGEIKEYARLIDDEVCINGMYASDNAFPNHNNFHLTTKSKRINLLYNDEDEPFSVDTGCVAVSINIADMAGIKRGDKIRITSQMGNVFELTVSEIYKVPQRIVCEELIISDADFEYLRPEFPFRLYKLLLQAKSVNYGNRISDELYDKGLVINHSMWEFTQETDPDYTVITVISYFLVGMSVMIILIMFITLRFMMAAAIKQEEKEIGMMRAIGVDSPKYRWMFSAVYVVFAVLGGVAGVFAGAPLSKKCIRSFCKNLISTNHYSTIYIALIVSVTMIALIILFAAFMMRRINKISVIETIHGDSEGERFGKLNRLNLYKTKRIKVPAFLAVGNVVNSFKKYIFLVITYMLAVIILLVVFDLKSTLMSDDYSKNFLMLKMDVLLHMNEDMAQYYYQKGGDYKGANELLVEDLNKEGIPVVLRYFDYSSVDVTIGDEELSAEFYFGDTYNEEIPLRKGGKLPVLENEVIVSYFTAKKENLKIGDTISIKLKEYDDDHIGTHTVTRDFLITGFFDIMEEGTMSVIAGREYDGAAGEGIQITDMYIDAPKSEHAAYIQKTKDFLGEDNVETIMESKLRSFSYISGYIDAMKIILSVTIAFILSLNTLLYTTVDLARETPAVAMLKCVGFSNKDVRRWQMLRMLIILVIAFILGCLFKYTLGNMIVAKIFENFGITGFCFIGDLKEQFLIVPLIVFGILIAALRVCLGKVKCINIWNIREE